VLLPIIATAVAGGVTAAAYQTVSPTGQWFGPAFCRSALGSNQIALTFDDGPNDPHSFNLLDVLSKHNVSATFFLIGSFVRRRPDIVVEIAQRGHVIGNHTFTHPLLTFEPASRIRDEIIQCRNAINEAVGEHSNLFRPPWGGRRPATFRIVRELALEPVMWNITGYDWKAQSAAFIEQKVAPKVRGGDVVLLHDGGHRAFGTDRSCTVQAVGHLLDRYKDQYKFVTIPQLMRGPHKNL
jgi:peptidoglycan/xylan/chitin deacetylase (PgdA/CDA1 family)